MGHGVLIPQISNPSTSTLITSGLLIGTTTNPNGGINRYYYSSSTNNAYVVAYEEVISGVNWYRILSYSVSVFIRWVANSASAQAPAYREATLIEGTNYYEALGTPGSPTDNFNFVPGSNIYVYSSREEALAGEGILQSFPINYRLTNCSAPSAPVEAVVGDTVNVPFEFPEGYGIVNPSTDIYVMSNGVLVPSTYSDGQLVFTMPDPS